MIPRALCHHRCCQIPLPLTTSDYWDLPILYSSILILDPCKHLLTEKVENDMKPSFTMNIEGPTNCFADARKDIVALNPKPPQETARRLK